MPDMLKGIKRAGTKKLFKSLDLRHIKDIIGVRRCGKTTVMHQIMDELICDGISAKDIILLNFDDFEINNASFEQILKEIYKINPDMQYIFLDEIQQKNSWEQWVRTLYDTMKFRQIFVSGSSSSVLSSDMSRVLTGRHISFETYPFSFAEYLRYHGWIRFDRDFLAANKAKILHYQKKYLEDGGFPETLGRSDAERKEVLTNLFNDIIARDVVSRQGADPDIAKKVAYYIISNSGKEFSLRRIADSLGIAVGTVSKYISYLNESFMTFETGLFSHKLSMQFRHNKKAYCIDTGLMNSVAFKCGRETGRQMELAVFLELKRRGREIYYWKGEKQKEVDFVVRDGGELELMQVCASVEDAGTRERETSSLLSAMESLGLRGGTIITEDHEGSETTNGKEICFIPLWKWLLK